LSSEGKFTSFLNKTILGGVIGNVLEWYNIAQSLVGGTSLLISTWLISRTGDIASPAFYLMAVSIISLIAAFALDPKYGDQVKG